MTDTLDDRIRDTVAEIVHTAPTPLTFAQLGAQIGEPPRRPNRRWLPAAASVIVLAGIVGVAFAIQSRDGGTAPATIPSVPSVPTPATAPVDPPSTPSATPSTRPPLPDPAGFSTGPFPEIPDGSLDVGDGDLIGVTSDGNISLYPDMFSAEPGEPVVLRDSPHPGQLLVPLEAVALNGALISNMAVDWEFDLPQARTVTILTEPQSEPVGLVGGALGPVSHDGTRFLVHERVTVRNDLAVYDTTHGTVARRGMTAFPSYAAGVPTFAWSPDDRELYSFSPDNGRGQAVFTRIDSATLEVIDTTVVEDFGLDGRFFASKHSFFLGLWDGRALFIGDDGVTSAYDVPGMTLVEIDVPHWLSTFTPGSPVTYFDIAADGTTAVWISDGTTYVQRIGEEPVAVRDDLVQVAFVDAVTADPAPPPASTSPTTDPEIPGLFPEPGDTALSTFTAIAPSGSIDGAPGDIVSLSVDGDLWLHTGAFDPPQYARSPGDPIRLVDGEDPRVSVEEGPGPNVVDWVGGFINGAVLYGECCEPAAGNVFAVSDPDGPPASLGYGWSAAADTTGRRWATANDYGLQLLDFDVGRGASRVLNEANEEWLNVGSVTWVGEEIWLLAWSDAAGSILVRYQADAGLTEIARHELAPAEGGVPTAAHAFAGRLADGTIVLTETAGPFGSELRTTGLRLLGPDGADAAGESPWPALPFDAQGVRVSPDGTTLAYTIADTAYLLRAGEQPVEWATDVRSVWFVTTPPTPIGRPCQQDPEPDGFRLIERSPFADLDGDGISERIMLRADGPLYWVRACGTASAFPDTEIYAPSGGASTIVPIDVEGDGQTELWISGTYHGTSPDLPCVALYRAAGSVLEPTTENRCIGDVGFACAAVDGVTQPVFYERQGDALRAILDDGTVLGTRRYAPEDELQHLFDLAC